MADRRLSDPAGDELRRAESIDFRFDGRPHTGVGGDTIASALVADGLDILSRSFKYHRPRGVLCAAGRCPNCLVQVNGEPNVRACVTPVVPAMVVRSQNAWPSLGLDLLSLTDRFDRFFPIGFYYKTFIRPRRFWPLYEAVLRRIAGLGRVDITARPDLHPRKRHLHADVAVVGGGPAGCLAALEAAGAGARVVLVDDGTRLGGHLRMRSREVTGDARLAGLPGVDAARRLAALVAAEPRIEHLAGATAIGIYDDGLVGITQGSTFVRLRAGRIVLAAGAAERPALFHANDRPGIMLASGILRLIHLHGVRPGRRAIVVTDDDHGWRQATELIAAGIEVAAIVDTRSVVPEIAEAATVRAAGSEMLPGATVLAAQGRSRVTGLRIRGGDGVERVIAADLVAMATRPEPVVTLAAQAGLSLAFEERLAEWIPVAGSADVVVTGHMTGLTDDELIAAGAVLSGRLAAGRDGAGAAHAHHAEQVAAAFAVLPDPAPTVLPAGRKPFVCLCEDVTAKELVQGVAEGFDSLETLKRYSTVTMGPCQGKQCHGNAARVTAAIRGVSRTTTGLTTYRPPFQPVPLAVIAGPHLHPVRRTALHDRHEAAGATWMDMGDWKRPLHYGDIEAECRAVHERVGLIDVSTLGKLDVRGRDAGEFLDWLHPNRFSDLKVGRIRYRAMTDDAGIILDDGTVARLGDDRYFVTTGTGSLDAVDGWLRWWLAASDRRVDVTNVTARFAAMNLAGPRARDVLAGLTDVDVSPDGLRYLDAREGLVAGVPAVILRIGFVGELAYELHAPADQAVHLWDALITAGAGVGIRPFGVEAQRILRLEKQHAIVGQDTDALSDPRGASMGWLVKADRPDFIGRDALAALAERGPRDVLTGFEMIGTAVPAEGAAVVRDGRPIGRVTSSKWSTTLGKAIGLAWLPAEDVVEDGQITVRLGTGREGSTALAVVRTAPFYDPEGTRVRS
ncbi:MAG: aminomethyltransferase [Chloroflexi bacterium]|nr:aminomethyltransferase [Chloroflexota bacterium]